jgi:hypothetical protein
MIGASSRYCNSSHKILGLGASVARRVRRYGRRTRDGLIRSIVGRTRRRGSATNALEELLQKKQAGRSNQARRKSGAAARVVRDRVHGGQFGGDLHRTGHATQVSLRVIPCLRIGAAFALTSASRRARTRSIGSRSRARGSLLIFNRPPAPSLPRPRPSPLRNPNCSNRFPWQSAP